MTQCSGRSVFKMLAMDDDDGRHATEIEIAEHEHCRRIAGDDSTPPPFAVSIPSSARFDAEVHPPKGLCIFYFREWLRRRVRGLLRVENMTL